MTAQPHVTTTTATAVAMAPHPVAVAIRQIMSELKRQFFERDEVIEAMWLAIIANEHCFILGPPGTSKSYLTRETFKRIVGIKYFEALLSKNRPAEAIIGPLDIPQLRDEGHYHRKWSGFLPDADYAMLDEIGKMSPTLGHDLLAILLERLLHEVNGGRSAIPLNLRTVIGGSNELPTAEDDDAAALYDRMLVRCTVDYIKEAGNFAALMENGAPTIANPTTVDFADLADAVDNVVPTIRIPADVIQVLGKLREELRKEEITPSDRRWSQARKLLKASAFLDGRDEVSADDIAVLRFVLWDMETQIRKVERVTLSVSNPLAEEALTIMEKVEELRREVGKVDPGLSDADKAGLGVEMGGRIRVLMRDIDKLRQKAAQMGAATKKIDEIRNDVIATRAQIHADLLNIDAY